MVKSADSQLSFELLWWAFTLVLAALVVLPVYTFLPGFPFYTANVIYVIVAVTMTRYLFFLDISWLRDRLLVQVAILILVIPLIFYMVNEFNLFVTYFDEQGPDVLTRNLPDGRGTNVDGYLKTEYRFFGIWAIIAAGLIPFRFTYNVWMRYRAGVR